MPTIWRERSLYKPISCWNTDDGLDNKLLSKEVFALLTSECRGMTASWTTEAVHVHVRPKCNHPSTNGRCFDSRLTAVCGKYLI